VKHLLIVASVFALMFFAVLGVRGFGSEKAPRDEILAYEINAERGVEVTLHGGVSQVTLTSWLMVPIGTPSEDPLPFAFDVQLIDADGNVRATRRFGNFSRLPVDGPDTSAYKARVVDAVAWVTEPRTVDVDTQPLSGGAGRLRVQAVPGKYNQILLRLAHRVKRSALEKALLARTMSGTERASLTGERSSLGFFDMPDAVRADAIAYWQQRLMAAGREGRDYTVRRLLIGDQKDSEEPLWLEAGLETSPEQRLVLNLKGPVSLRVQSSEAAQIVVAPVGQNAATRHAVPKGRAIELTLGDGPVPDEARSVVLYAEPRSVLSLSAPLEHAPQFMGSEPLRQVGGRLEVRPTLSYQPAHVLHPEEAIVLGLGPGQPRLGLSVRSRGVPDARALAPECLAPDAARTATSATERNVRATWHDAAGAEVSRSDLRFPLRLSCFERIDGLPASERALGHLHVPERASELRLFGEEDLVVSPFVPEPGVEEVVLSPPYDLPPPLGLRWRHAPTELKDWAVIRPDNDAALRSAGRTASLQAQVRLAPIEEADPAVAPRTLEPLGEALSRPVFSPTTYSAKYPFPDYGWVIASTERPEREVVVPSSGTLQVLYLADTERLGQPWSVLAADAPTYSGPLAFRSGARQLELPPGNVRLSFEGLGAGGLLFAQAAPAGGGAIVRRQTFHALDPGSSLHFEFRRRENELLAVSVTVATPGGNASVQLEHAVDAGRTEERAGHFYRRTSQYEGRHALRTGAEGHALIWSEPFAPDAKALPDRLGRVIIPLGDDLSVGSHRLRLRHPAKGNPVGGNRYWVRAVLVGRVLGHP
jgi:hypothetical protein